MQSGFNVQVGNGVDGIYHIPQIGGGRLGRFIEGLNLFRCSICLDVERPAQGLKTGGNFGIEAKKSGQVQSSLVADFNLVQPNPCSDAR